MPRSSVHSGAVLTCAEQQPQQTRDMQIGPLAFLRLSSPPKHQACQHDPTKGTDEGALAVPEGLGEVGSWTHPTDSSQW